MASLIEVFFGNTDFFNALIGQSNRLMFIIDTAPLVLGFVFYLVGVKQEKISELYHRKSKSVLEKSQSLLETAERIGKYGSWEIDIATMQSSWSKGLYTIFQLDPSDKAPDLESFMSFVLPSDQHILQNAFNDAVKNGKSEFTIQYRVKLKDQSIRMIRGHGSVIVNGDNIPVKMCGTVQDVTELASAQAETQFYKQAIDQAAIVAITDRSGIITHANENFCSISGYTKEELIGKPHSIVNSKTMGEDFFRNMWKTISSGKIWRGDICNRTKGGDLYWVDSVIIPFLDAEGRPEGYVSIRSDISSKKMAEQEILQAHQRLELAEEVGRIGSMEYDERREKFYASKGLCNLLQFPEGVTPNYKLFTDPIEPDDRNILESAMDESIVSKQPFSCSFRVNQRDRAKKWFNAEGRPIYKADGKFQKLMVSIQDITEKVESDQHLIEATHRAEQANKTKARFLANMSHEIRTPMNGIIGMTNLLLGSTESQEQVDKLKIIQNCANNLLDLINDILDFSKLEVDKLELENEPFALHESVREIVELLNTRASEKGLILSYLPDSNVPSWVKGDITRFRQIVTNLLSNAIKFTEKGSVTISSKASHSSDGQFEIQFAVKDTGVGIPEEVKSRLFLSFSQVDASTTRKFGGTGLGLAITKGLCEKMGGRVWVESTVGQGSTFIFTFKAQAAEEVKGAQPANPFATVNPEMGKRNPLSILIAEDNRVNQLVAVGLLGKLGYQADVASNGLEALENLKMKSYDLVLMDCHMPLMDGFETAKKIVEMFPKNTRPRIVAVTASTMKEDVSHCIEAGMDDFIEKPITVASLLKVVAECPSLLNAQASSTKVSSKGAA